MKDFGHDQINDPHLRRVVFYANAEEVFGKAAGISDGITIVEKDMQSESDKFDYVYKVGEKETTFRVEHPGEDLLPLNPQNLNIIHKIQESVVAQKLEYLHENILPRSLFGIESNFVEENPEKVRLYHDGDSFDKRNEVKVFTNDRAGKRGRATWFVTKRDEIKQGRNLIGEWQVVVSSANAGGQKRDNQLAIMDEYSVFGRSRVALKSFATLREAQNFKKYVESTFIRYAFLLTDENLSALAKYVPDFGDYSDKNKFIDFHRDIDSQLYRMFNLTEDEIDFIKVAVDDVWGRR